MNRIIKPEYMLGVIQFNTKKLCRSCMIKALAENTVSSSWARQINFTLTVPLFNYVYMYKWVPANLILGANHALD